MSKYEIKKRHPLSKRDIKVLNRELERFNAKLSHKDEVEYIEFKGGDRAYIVNGKPEFLKVSGLLIPTLMSKSILSLPRVYVDEGAVPHILNGADVLAPGIIKWPEDVNNGDIVLVIGRGKPLAIGKVIEGWNEALKRGKGKIIKNLHFAGDRYLKVLLKRL